ncbi:MAG TPA: hypothetical protein VLN74_11005, partial [Ilumatobacteraceae bacterium]|nr:hypothetical protein [Ilumatobacteraceae bacterium]
MNTTTIHRGLAAVAVGAILLTTACGDDDTSSDSTLGAAGCDAYASIGAAMFGDPAGLPDSVAALSAEASDDLRASATAYGDALLAAFDGDEDAMSSPEFKTADAEVGEAVLASCDTVADLDVRGIDFAFEGIPDEIEAGRVSIEFTNATDQAEPHEMLLMMRVDGADEPVTELLDLPEEELFGKVVPTALTYADEAGGTNVALVDLEPGAYNAICMIPTEGDGPPH